MLSSITRYIVKVVQDDISSKTIRIWLRNAVDYTTFVLAYVDWIITLWSTNGFQYVRATAI